MENDFRRLKRHHHSHCRRSAGAVPIRFHCYCLFIDQTLLHTLTYTHVLRLVGRVVVLWLHENFKLDLINKIYVDQRKTTASNADVQNALKQKQEQQQWS